MELNMTKLAELLDNRGLTLKENITAQSVAMGLSNAEIANQLFITEKTVKCRLTSIYNKLNLKSRAQLIVYCLPHTDYGVSK